MSIVMYYCDLILLVALISLALFSVSINDLERKVVCKEGGHFYVNVNKIRWITPLIAKLNKSEGCLGRTRSHLFKETLPTLLGFPISLGK